MNIYILFHDLIVVLIGCIYFILRPIVRACRHLCVYAVLKWLKIDDIYFLVRSESILAMTTRKTLNLYWRRLFISILSYQFLLQTFSKLTSLSTRIICLLMPLWYGVFVNFETIRWLNLLDFRQVRCLIYLCLVIVLTFAICISLVAIYWNVLIVVHV